MCIAIFVLHAIAVCTFLRECIVHTIIPVEPNAMIAGHNNTRLCALSILTQIEGKLR